MRSPLDFSPLPFVLMSVLAGCSPALDTEELASETASLEVPGGATDTALHGASRFFAIAADRRMCAAPLCGGWNLVRLNREMTRCHDGQYAEWCYTPELDWSEANLSDEQQTRLFDACYEGSLSEIYAIVRGRFARTNRTTPAPEMGRFVISEAWVAEGEPVSDGLFVRVEDNGLRCFQAPCPSYTETVLNRAISRDIAEVDFAPSGLSESEIEECTQSMSEPGGILLAGHRYTVDVEGRTARGRTVTAAYDRLVDTEE